MSLSTAKNPSGGDMIDFVRVPGMMGPFSRPTGAGSVSYFVSVSASLKQRLPGFRRNVQDDLLTVQLDIVDRSGKVPSLTYDPYHL
jgi:hypothetical protein